MPPLLTQFGERGTGAGEFEQTRAMVASPSTGHIFVVDSTRGVERTSRLDEFTAWGEFVKAWGWGVRDGAAEPQTCGPEATPPTSTCLPGLEGEGAGEFNQPTGIAIDGAGDLFVSERVNSRVQKFSPSGEFILTFGGEVDRTTGGNICAEASGDTCQAGTVGAGDGQFDFKNLSGVDGNVVAVDPADTVYVADNDRIQKFTGAGVFTGGLPLPEPGEPGALAADPSSGDLYFAFSQDRPPAEPSKHPDVYRLDPSIGAVLGKLTVPRPSALAVDSAGDVYVSIEAVFSAEIIEFDSSGLPVVPEGSGFGPPLDAFGRIGALVTNTVTAGGDLNLVAGFEEGNLSANIDIFGPPPDKWPPPAHPPSIDAQFASTVGTDSAVVKAKINPRFWADTSYFVEYGTAPCSSGGCAKQPAPPGQPLNAGIVNAPVATEGIELGGLQPGTHYFFRFVSQSGGGGPTVGRGEGHLEAIFTTRVPETPSTACPNQAFRTGASALLPDCRAYEMVSPVAKNDGDVLVQCNINCYPARLDQAAESGARFTYSAYRAFGDAKSSPYSSQYLATRQPDGWQTHSISPPQEGAPPQETPVLDGQFDAFSPQLDRAWLTDRYEPLLAPGAVPGFTNIYRLDTQTGAYQAVTTVKPSNVSAGNYEVELQGLAAGGETALVRANGKLTGNASSKEPTQVYEFEGGVPKLVSLRPNKTPNAASATVGSASETSPAGRTVSLFHAVSTDGSRVFWSEPMAAAEQGKLYVRLDGQETVQIAEHAEFVTANPDGSTVVFRTAAHELVEFDVDTEQATTIAPSVQGVTAFSDDASTVYFVATDALAAGATASRPNLYLHRAGQPLAFVATLDPGDVSAANSFATAALRPTQRGTRVSADGGVLVFMSRADLTGYDNADRNSGEPDSEVYRYDAATATLACVSCNPTGARPLGRPLEAQGIATAFWGAAAIPGWASQFYPTRVLSDDGDRVFFDSTDALALRDANAKQDVYEWELAGTGGCTAQSPEFAAESGGCISLISGGASPTDSEFLDASADGSEAFFTTAEKLVAQDPGQIDVYVARVDGGFPPAAGQTTPCEGEDCQPRPAPPAAPQTSSDTFAGPPNPQPVRPRKCGPGKRKVTRHRKVRCVPAGQRSRHRGGGGAR